MRNLSCITACIIVFYFIYSCTDKKHHSQKVELYQHKASYNKIDFNSVIQDHRNDSLEFYEGLLSNKSFVNILEHDTLYLNDELSFLNRKKLNAAYVAVSICAMQNLSVNDYVKICKTILKLHNANKLPVTSLEHAVSPDFLRKRIIINNYKKSEVRALLQSIQNNKTITDQKFLNRLPDILSGKSSKELKKFDQENGYY